MEATVLAARRASYELVNVRGRLFLKQKQEKLKRARRQFSRF